MSSNNLPDNLEMLVNPPQPIFDELIQKAAETDGWAHQPYDYPFWRQNFDDYWYFAIVEKDTQNLVVGACLARWDDEKKEPLYSIGLYYCVEKYRGKGHGSKIFKAIMDIVGDANACLTGALDMVPKYAKNYGFSIMPDYFHYHTTLEMKDLKIPEHISEEIFTENWKNVNPEQLNNYDLSICPRNRKNLMRAWFDMPEVFTRVAFCKNSGKILGYCTIRVVNLNRLCACPFYAEDLKTAERLLADTLQEIPSFQKFENFFVWHPEINKNVEKLFQKFSKSGNFTMEKDFKTQFRTKLIATPDEKVFSVADSTHQFV